MDPSLLETGAPLSAVPPVLGVKQKWLLALAAVSILSAGLPTLKKGWIALKNLTLNIYFLMSLAVAGAVLIGKWPEAAMVVCLFAVAEAIEALSLERARNAIRSLTALAPETAYLFLRYLLPSFFCAFRVFRGQRLLP